MSREYLTVDHDYTKKNELLGTES